MTKSRVLGVLGGLGPVASAEFVRTVYACCEGDREQDFPAVVLHSDPRFPHRSASAMNGGDLPRLFADGVAALLAQGCDKVVVACMTMHHLLPRLPGDLRAAVLSVPDVLMAQLTGKPGRHLLLCSRDTREVRLFEQHSAWARVEPAIVLPSITANNALQGAIGYLKTNRGHEAARQWLTEAATQCDVSSVAVACSEFHLLARHWPAEATALTWVDPFERIARALATREDLDGLTTPEGV